MFQTLASAPLTAIVSGTAFTSTITINEAGVLHLSNGMLTGSNDDPQANEPTDISSSLEITSLEINGSIVLLKGRNSPSVGNCLSPHRAGNFVQLPDIKVDSGDTIAIGGMFLLAGIATGDGIWSVPFSPARFLGKRNPIASGAQAIVGSPATPVADDIATTLTVTIENHGFVNLNNAWISWHLDATANVPPVSAQNVALFGGMTALTVRNDYPMVVGQGSVVASTAFLSPARTRNYVYLGVHEVSPGDTVTATVRADLGAAGDASFGFPQWLPSPGKCVNC